MLRKALSQLAWAQTKAVATPPRLRSGLLAGQAPHQQLHQLERGSPLGPTQRAVAEGFEVLLTHLHLVWGRVVPDIPNFYRELGAALAEE
jgi:hypothetical protein